MYSQNHKTHKLQCISREPLGPVAGCGCRCHGNCHNASVQYAVPNCASCCRFFTNLICGIHLSIVNNMFIAITFFPNSLVLSQWSMSQVTQVSDPLTPVLQLLPSIQVDDINTLSLRLLTFLSFYMSCGSSALMGAQFWRASKLDLECEIHVSRCFALQHSKQFYNGQSLSEAYLPALRQIEDYDVTIACKTIIPAMLRQWTRYQEVFGTDIGKNSLFYLIKFSCFFQVMQLK